jgi:LuxR family transcriptional regulator
MGYFSERMPPPSGSDEEQLLALLPVMADRLEFTYWSFLLLDWRRPGRVLFHSTNLPIEWQAAYVKQHWYQTDPARLHGLHSVQPLHWQPTTFAATPQMQSGLQALDACHGITQACHHASGPVAILSLGRAGPLDAKEFEAKAPHVMELVHRLCTLSLAIHAQEVAALAASNHREAPLTEREIAILSHAADGLTAAEIAQRISLTERTVQFHVSSAIAKLGVPNKTAAVVRAMLLQLF